MPCILVMVHTYASKFFNWVALDYAISNNKIRVKSSKNTDQVFHSVTHLWLPNFRNRCDYLIEVDLEAALVLNRCRTAPELCNWKQKTKWMKVSSRHYHLIEVNPEVSLVLNRSQTGAKIMQSKNKKVYKWRVQSTRKPQQKCVYGLQ